MAAPPRHAHYTTLCNARTRVQVTCILPPFSREQLRLSVSTLQCTLPVCRCTTSGVGLGRFRETGRGRLKVFKKRQCRNKAHTVHATRVVRTVADTVAKWWPFSRLSPAVRDTLQRSTRDKIKALNITPLVLITIIHKLVPDGSSGGADAAVRVGVSVEHLRAADQARGLRWRKPVETNLSCLGTEQPLLCRFCFATVCSDVYEVDFVTEISACGCCLSSHKLTASHITCATVHTSATACPCC